MRKITLYLIIFLFSFSTIFADIVSTPLGNKLRSIFPELRNGYIDLNKNGSLDELDDMNEKISDFLVQDDQLQVQETLEFIRKNYKYFPIRALESVRDALDSPEGTINELIGLNYRATISLLIDKRIAMGEYGLYLPPSAKRKAMDEMAVFLSKMNEAYKKEGRGAEKDFISAKKSLYEMLEKGYPLPDPLSTKEREILESTLLNTLIREQNNEKYVNTALYSLGLLRSTRGIPYILPLVENEKYGVESIRSLGAIGNLEALDLLLIKLEENPEEEIKTEIVRALGTMGSRESIAPLFKVIGEESVSEDLRKVVLESLGKIASRGINDRKISTTLLEYLKSSDPSLRIIAINGLSAFKDQATVNTLLGLFKLERSETVLLSLVDRAKYINNPSIVPSLINLLENPQTSMEIKINCLSTIGSHAEGIKGINGVIKALSSRVTEIKDAAYIASKELYKTNNSALIAGLSRSVATNDDLVFQQNAAKLFAELPDPSAVLSLQSMLSSSDPLVKRYATLALYRIRPAGNVRITTALNKIVSNETEPLDVRINAVRALGAGGFDNPIIKVEQTLITAAAMRDEKYAQLKLYSIRSLGQLPTLALESIEKMISIAARERDSSIRKEAIHTLSNLGISNPLQLAILRNSLESVDLQKDPLLALLICEILGEAQSNDFINIADELYNILDDNSHKRRLAYALYLAGSEESYGSLIKMGSDNELINFISSLLESVDKNRLNRVLESLKRSETDQSVLTFLENIKSEVLQTF